MFGLGAAELFFIFLIVFLLFGARNLPEIAKSMGRMMHQFRRGVREIEDEVRSVDEHVVKKINDGQPE